MIKEIDFTSALKRIAEGSNQVCMLVPISADTLYSLIPIREDTLIRVAGEIDVKGFALVTEPKKTGKQMEKFGARHCSGWSKAPNEIVCSDQTVLNVIKELEADNDGDNSKD